MIYVKWFVNCLVLMVARIFVKMAASWLVKNYSSEDKKHLVSPFEWVNTVDHDLGGDEPWEDRRMVGEDKYSDENRIEWVKRNGGQHLALFKLGVRASDIATGVTTGVEETDIFPFGKKKTVVRDLKGKKIGFYYKRVIKTPIKGEVLVMVHDQNKIDQLLQQGPSTYAMQYGHIHERVPGYRCLEFMLGWKLNDVIAGQHKIICSLRAPVHEVPQD